MNYIRATTEHTAMHNVRRQQCLIYYVKYLGIRNIFLDINYPKALKCLSD